MKERTQMHERVTKNGKTTFPLLKALFDILPYAISYIDQNNTYQFCNKQFEHIMGRSHENIEGKSILDVLSKEASEKLLSTIQEVLRIKTETCYIQESNQNKNKSKIFNVKVLPFFDSLSALKEFSLVKKISLIKRKLNY